MSNIACQVYIVAGLSSQFKNLRKGGGYNPPAPLIPPPLEEAFIISN